MDKEYYDLKMKCQNELAPHNLATIKYLKYLEKQLKATNDSKPVVDTVVMRRLRYWKKRCNLAEDFLNISPFDWRTEEQIKAYDRWRKKTRKEEPKY